MLLVGFLASVAAGYFAQPYAIWIAKRFWRCGLIGFWMTEEARERMHRDDPLADLRRALQAETLNLIKVRAEVDAVLLEFGK